MSALVRRYGKGTDSDATDGLLAYTLGSNERNRSQGPANYAWQQGDDSKHTGTGRGRSWVARAGDYTGALSETRHDAIAGQAHGVRRLTPTECCRLQGFPDDWLGAPNEPPDSPRYAALGDAVTVNVAHWIGLRIIEADRNMEV